MPEHTNQLQRQVHSSQHLNHHFIFPNLFSSGKKLSLPFIQLPSRREYPDYYEQIERPMDLNRIRKKIEDDKYTSLEQMSADVDLLCVNAQV